MLEDKMTLTRKRAELVDSLATQIAPEDRVRIQGELSLVNAKIKALNTTQAAQLKADADRRKIAGLAEAQANANRAVARAQGKQRSWPSSSPGEPGFGDPINKKSIAQATPEDDDEDPGQTAAIDGWIDAVLLRHDVNFTRDDRGYLVIATNATQHLATAIEALVAGIYAAARGQELPDLPRGEPKAPKSPKTPKAKPKKR